MGNSDSKSAKGTPGASLTSAQSYRNEVHTLLEVEFHKRADTVTQLLSRDGFHACLRSVQVQFDFNHFAGSPLATGLIEHFARERPGGKAVLSITEYASAMAVLFNNMDAATMTRLTNQAILRWFQVVHRPTSVPASLTDDILVAYFEAVWVFAWAELSTRVSSNFCLNGKSETEAIEKFCQANSKYFSAHPHELSLAAGSPLDKTLVVSIGDEEVSVPTSFSFLSKRKVPAASNYVLGRSPNRGTNAYPEL